MKQNTRALGRKNGGPGVLPSAVEASYFLEFLDTFSSRKKYQNLMALGKKTNYDVILWSMFPSCQKQSGMKEFQVNRCLFLIKN